MYGTGLNLSVSNCNQMNASKQLISGIRTFLYNGNLRPEHIVNT